MDASAIVAVLRESVTGLVIDEAPSVDMPTVYVNLEVITEVARTLRDHPALQFALLVDVTAADYLPAQPRFEVVYHFACLGPAFTTSGVAAPARRLRVKVRVPGDAPTLPSIVSVFPAANWPERELFDLFGLTFELHPDLRRILMPNDWEGSPLRKDYPVQIRKDTASWSPLQVTAEEFAATIREQRSRSTRQAQQVSTPDSRGH